VTGADRRIAKLLVANRGEIARRVFRTARQWGMATVAVYSEPDAGAPFVAEADEAVPIGGTSAAESYLRAEAILAAARRTGADAVHPGYGFLSENAEFARACAGAGLVFVGPSPEAIEAMGSKVAARRLMTSAGVPVVPGAELAGNDPAVLAAAAAEVGLPLLVKASAGGGGRGMRLVGAGDDLAAAVASARREALAAFADGTVFLERYIQPARHVEIQIVGDEHGNVATLLERDCSVQRRHQKIVEEAPSPAVDADLRRRMEAAAVDAALAVGYVGAGTVEFVLGPDGEFFFLEMNTRLQVEHPVTEAITGLDLVGLQLLVAQGGRLPPEAMSPTMRGHAIEARIYAEDPGAGYAPSAGVVESFELPDWVRVDSAVEAGTIVGVEYDPMLAKVVAWAPSRAEAAARLAGALGHARIHGLTTNRALLVGILTHPEFLAGAADTGFLDRHPPAELVPAPDDRQWALAALAATLADQAANRRNAPVLATLPSGWRNSPSGPQFRRLEAGGRLAEVGYRLGRTPVFEVDGARLDDVVVLSAEPDAVDVMDAGVRRRYQVSRGAERLHVDGGGVHVSFAILPRFPEPAPAEATGSLAAPMPGRVSRVEVVEGDRVEVGDVLVVIEAMKMEHRLTAPEAGTVEAVKVQPGMTVKGGDVVVILHPEEDPA